MTDREQTSLIPIVRKQKLYASVIRACKNCGAPGFWHNTPGVNVGCYAPDKVTTVGENPVGSICPNCGASREEIEPKGLIWSKNFYAPLPSLWRHFKHLAKELVAPFLPARR